MYKCMHLVFFVDRLGPPLTTLVPNKTYNISNQLEDCHPGQNPTREKDKLWNFSNGAFLNPSVQLIFILHTAHTCIFSSFNI